MIPLSWFFPYPMECFFCYFIGLLFLCLLKLGFPSIYFCHGFSFLCIFIKFESHLDLWLLYCLCADNSQSSISLVVQTPISNWFLDIYGCLMSIANMCSKLLFSPLVPSSALVKPICSLHSIFHLNGRQYNSPKCLNVKHKNHP